MLLARRGVEFQVSIIQGPYSDTASIGTRLNVIDLDGDRLKDIIFQHNYETYGDAPSHSATIFRNTRKSFAKVYYREMDDWLEFEDLDRNHRLEIIEAINEVREDINPTYFWINIYEWDGLSFRPNPPKYLDFYLNKEKLYKREMKELKNESEGYGEFQRKKILNVLQAYIRRIEAMKKSGSMEK